jgi:3-deoxy-D-manno-octulosonic-acid transferase
MRLLYDIGIRFYWLAAWIASGWNLKARRWIRGRKDWLHALQEKIDPDEPVIWFHCSSLGEFEQGRPLIEEARRRFPDRKILLSFFSPSGYEKRKHYEGADHVMYLPLDTARNARRLTGALHLEMVLFIKYEFWYHFLHRLRVQQTPLYLASGIFRPGQLFFRGYGRWYRKFLECFTHIFVQQETSRELLRGIGISRVTVAGDTRFDRVQQVAATSYSHPLLEQLTAGRTTLVAGSTWERDEQLLAHAVQHLPDDFRWIIAPHELSTAHLDRLERRFPGSRKLSRLQEEELPETRVIIVDTIGQLSYLYRFGTLAYVGGGFGKGIHNILEPAAYGLPVCFGPAYHKFQEALELIDLGGAFPVLNEKELLFTIHQQVDHEQLLKTTSDIAGNYVTDRVGATSTIMDLLCKNSTVNML